MSVKQTLSEPITAFSHNYLKFRINLLTPSLSKPITDFSHNCLKFRIKIYLFQITYSI